MYLKDYDLAFFTRLVQSKEVLGYFTKLLFSNSSEPATLQSIYDGAKGRWKELDLPLEVIVKEIESTIIGYSDSQVGNDVVDIDITKYRSVAAAIQGEILPEVEDVDYRLFLVNLLNGKVIK